MEDTIKTLLNFIDRAQKDRKYPPNTAISFRIPLKLVEPELNDEEKKSLETFKDHVEQIMNTIYSKGISNKTSDTLQEYKRRLYRVIADYDTYGKDPSKMASWNRATRSRIPRLKKEKNIDKVQEIGSPLISDELTKAELPLSGGKAIFYTPKLKKSDIAKIKAYINFLEETLTEDNEGGSGRVASPSTSQVD